MHEPVTTCLTDAWPTALIICAAAGSFALVCALCLYLMESAVLQPRREKLFREAVERIARATAEKPSRPDDALVQVMEAFTGTSKTILIDAREQHAALTRDFTARLLDASRTMDARIDAASGRWEELLRELTGLVRQRGGELAHAAGELTEATREAGGLLRETTKTLEGCRALSGTIAEARAESSRLVGEVTERMERIVARAEAGLEAVAKAHVQALEQESETANKRLADLMDALHTRSAATLGVLASTMQKAASDLGASWQDLADAVDRRVGDLIKGWQSTLGAAVSDLKEPLSAINRNLQTMENVSGPVLRSFTRAAEIVHHFTKEVLRRPEPVFDRVDRAISDCAGPREPTWSAGYNGSPSHGADRADRRQGWLRRFFQWILGNVPFPF